MRNTRNPVRFIASLSLGMAVLFYVSAAYAADPPATADVLAKIHEANQKEIRMGKLAEKEGKSKDVVAYAKTLVKDHTDADKKVTAMAKKEKVELPAATTGKDEDMANMAQGDAFDAHFTKAMLEDHKKTIADLTEVRDRSTDPKLKGLISTLLPTLKKHEETAQKLVDKAKL